LDLVDIFLSLKDNDNEPQFFSARFY